MTVADIDEDLRQLDEPKRGTLQQLRQDVLAASLTPRNASPTVVRRSRSTARQSQGLPRSKKHLSYLVHSGLVFLELEDDLAGYQRSSGALRFAWISRCQPD